MLNSEILSSSDIHKVDENGNRQVGTVRHNKPLRGFSYLDKWHGTERHSSLVPCTTKLLVNDQIIFQSAERYDLSDIGSNSFLWVDGVGIVRGILSRAIGLTCYLDIKMDDNAVAKYISTLLWLDRKDKNSIKDQREFPRYVPKNRDVHISFGSSVSVAKIIDISPSGAAVHSETIPPIKSNVSIGSVLGDVVRHMDSGFAVKFTREQEPTILEELLSFKYNSVISNSKFIMV